MNMIPDNSIYRHSLGHGIAERRLPRAAFALSLSDDCLLFFTIVALTTRLDFGRGTIGLIIHDARTIMRQKHTDQAIKNDERAQKTTTDARAVSYVTYCFI
jgi:hypothetical protein